jgi:Mn-dependent DtxR family transcriptional regulator
MAETRDGARLLLGNLNNYLKETLSFIEKNKRVTAKDFSDVMKLEANTSGTRLLNLHKKRLVKRTDEIRDGLRVWVYERL